MLCCIWSICQYLRVLLLFLHDLCLQPHHRPHPHSHPHPYRRSHCHPDQQFITASERGGSMVSKSNYASPIFSWQESCRIAGTVLRCELSGETAWQVMILCFRQSDVSDVSKKCSFPCHFPFQRNSRWKSLLKGPFPETWIEVAIFHEGRWWQDSCNDSKFMLVKSREEVLKYLLLWRSSLRAKKKNLLQPRNPQTRP